MCFCFIIQPSFTILGSCIDHIRVLAIQTSYLIYLLCYFFYYFFQGRHGSWIYNYLYNQCQSPLLKLRVQTLFMGGLLNTTLCDKVCQWLATGQWFSTGTLVSSTNKTNCHDMAEILLKVALNTINQPNQTKFFMIETVSP